MPQVASQSTTQNLEWANKLKTAANITITDLSEITKLYPNIDFKSTIPDSMLLL